MKNSSSNHPHRLNQYSLAAGAAGLTAGAHQTDAAITVYDNGGAGWTVADGTASYFGFNGSVAPLLGSGVGLRNYYALRQVIAGGVYTLFINTRLDAGVTVGTAVPPPSMNLTYYGAGSNGWSAPGTGYLGINFTLGGLDTYYAWMEITLDAYAPGKTITVNRYAVQSTPNTPIVTGDTGSSAVPEPGTLALLLLGATGLTALRRREG